MHKVLYFKLEYIAESMDFPEDELIQVEDNSPDGCTLTLRCLQASELKPGEKGGTLCTAIIQKVPSEEICRLLESGDGLESPALKELASASTDYRELYEYINQAVRVFRWIRNDPEDH